jgi:diphosphate-dependent phosphofructokinase
MMDQTILEKMAREQRQSPFERYLRTLSVAVCENFRNGKEIVAASFQPSGQILTNPDAAQIEVIFPETIKSHHNQVLDAVKISGTPAVSGKKVLVLFSGGPAAGGNNVLVGLFKALCPQNKLYGVKAGPGGLVKGDTFEITEEDAKTILNMGGFDFLGSDRTKIEELEQFERVKLVCKEQNIDAIVVVGGDDSNTNAAFLAERLFSGIHADGRGVQVIGVPKTIDGDLQVGKLLPISFGFDTATKIYAEMVGNIAQDTPSSRKYYHFVKIMGRSASHVALCTAQMVRPTITLISEEVAAKQWSLDEIATGLAMTIANRAANNIRHGVVIVPEGLIEFVPECKTLISELNSALDKLKDQLAGASIDEKKTIIRNSLSKESKKTLDSFPEQFRTMLLLDRDSHGNLPVSLIETEKLLILMTEEKVKAMQQNPENFPFLAQFSDVEMAAFKKYQYSTLSHFLGYEGRCGAPSKFDMAFCLNLGLCAGSLVLAGKTGYMAAITDLDQGGRALALPLAGLMNIEQRGAQKKVVIKKALVELDSPAFLNLKAHREYWASGDYFHSTGPRQFAGPKEVTDRGPILVMLNQGYATFTFNLGEELQIF